MREEGGHDTRYVLGMLEPFFFSSPPVQPPSALLLVAHFTMRVLGLRPLLRPGPGSGARVLDAARSRVRCCITSDLLRHLAAAFNKTIPTHRL